MSSRFFASSEPDPSKRARIAVRPAGDSSPRAQINSKKITELEPCAGARPAACQDLKGAVAVGGRGVAERVEQDQRALALPEVAPDLLAVVVRVGAQVQQVVGDLERHAEMATEGFER